MPITIRSLSGQITAMNNKGFSLVELQVSIVIASIMVIAIGTVASIGTKTFNNYQEEARIFTDIGYGIRVLQKKVRESLSYETVNVPAVDSDQWINPQLKVDDELFGLYQKSGSDRREFVHLKDWTNVSEREVLFSLPAGDNPNWSFIDCADGPGLCISLNNNTDADVPINLSARIKRRIQ